MKKVIKTLQVIKKGVLGTLLWGGTILGILFVITFFAVQIPYIQTKIVKSITDYLSTATDHNIEIGSVNISWFDRVSLDDIEVTDTFDSTMLQTQSLLVDFSLLDLIIEQDIILDAIQVSNSRLYLQKVNDSTALNITHFFRKLKANQKTTNAGESKKGIHIGKIKIENAIVIINDHRKKSASTPWDYNHIRYNEINSSLSDLIIRGDTVSVEIDQLSAFDSKNSLNIKSLSSSFEFSNQFMHFDDLELRTDHSYMGNSVLFSFTDPSNLSFFVDSVNMAVNFKNAIIHPYDLQLFSLSALPFKESMQLSGNLAGRIGRFELNELQLQLGQRSNITGSISMNGLPNIQETFMAIDLNNSKLFSEDLKKFTPEPVHPYLDSLQLIEAKASFLGFYSDFVANGSFTTGIGNVKSNLNLKLPNESFIGRYSGTLELEDFDLGRFLNEPLIDTVSMNGSINGNGFDQKSADFFLNASLAEVGYNNYKYTNLRTDAEFAAQFFEGKLAINDPNLNLNIDGTVDLRAGLDKVNITGRIDTLNLKALNLSKRDIFLRSKVDLDFVGLQLDSIIGFADFNDFYIRNEQRHLTLDTISIISIKNFDNRDLTIETELSKFNASGNYSYTTLFDDLTQIWTEYSLIFKNNKDSLQKHYSALDRGIPNSYEIDLALSVTDADPYLKLFTDKITVGKDTEIKGKFSNGKTTILQLDSHLDTLIIDGNSFYKNEFDLNTSKLSDSTEVLAMLFLSSEQQTINQSTSFNNFFLEAIWSGDKIDFNTNIEQVEADNRAHLFGNFAFLNNKYRLNFGPSDLVAIGRKWQFSTNNEIILDQNDIVFNNFNITHKDQEIELSGISSTDENKVLSLFIRNFQLDNLNPIINSTLSGVLDTEANITGRAGNLLVQSNLKISQLELNNFLIGDVNGTSNWENSYDRLRIGFEVDRLDRKVIQLGGYFYPKEQQQLDIVANFNETSLKVVEPFIAKNFENVDGSLTGQFTIGGNLEYPILEGKGSVKDGHVLVKYLNTEYTFNGNIVFTENEIGVRELNIRDVNNNLASANGGIFHNGFKNFVLDISNKLKNFQVVNTSSTDNQLYYGTGYVSGDVNFLGPIDNLQISAKATTEKGTRIFIPLSTNSSVVQEDFIKFVNLSEGSGSADKNADQPTINSRVNLKGIKLDIDLDITPDAYTELIFDIKSGDIIRGRGNGKIKLQINTDGDFLMFGDFVISNGGYNFTLKNIINKEFDLIEGSKISWYGDPYQGVMDITAEYSQLTSLLPLISQASSQDDLSESRDALRKYPAIVVLNLKGPLLSPEIGFDIRIQDYPENIAGYSMGPIINAFNSKINSDEQELKRQVFSLIILRRLAPENSFNVGGGQTLGSSVSEFISNQLSYWVSQVDENLEIDVDLTTLDQDAFNTFQLRLAYTFLDGRLKVSRDGGFTNVDNETDASAIVGDWTVEYLITSDGKLRAKMYNKTNYNAINRALGDANSTTAGFSIQYTRSFDQFRELLFKARKSPKIPKQNKKEINKDEIISTEGDSIENNEMP